MDEFTEEARFTLEGLCNKFRLDDLSMLSLQQGQSPEKEQTQKRGMSEEQKKEYREIFYLIDTKRTGILTIPEFEKLLELTQVNIAKMNLNHILEEADPSGKGHITIEDFILLMDGPVNLHHSPEVVLEAFASLAPHDVPDGTISAEELQQILCGYGPEQRYTAEEASQILKELQIDANGRVNYKALVESITL